ncbi:DUF7846 domain-containing protein [Halomicrococcus gelatinilyticus]|uniref:DUF7846 domain-containing protein n=1 Tax=Halomicrococcus gelatinilyticus TaxID=1702103 RepID=UPI002E0EB14F
MDRWRATPTNRGVPALVLPVTAGLLAAAIVFWLSTNVFPYLSVNHDEGVYLQQAAMLLDGQAFLHTQFPDAFRPWFFVVDGNRMYSKYTPVPAAVFALGKLAGNFQYALVGVAAANAALVVTLTRDAFDARTAALAGVALLGTPLFLLTSATFLPYAPTTMLNLAFAAAYVRAVRRDDHRWAAAAGVFTGLAFFARPYTAVLFVLPFAAHGLLELARTRPDHLTRPWPPAFRRVVGRYAVVSAFGLAWVGVTLAYNWYVTGSPLVFPYAAFAPQDGLGFGHRELLGYERDYTPLLALRANARLLWTFATRWTVAAPVGTLLAAVGVGAFLRRARSGWANRPGLSDRELRGIFAGLLVTVVVGNVYFWGNLNVLADLADPDDGFVALFGPFYHFDLLLPLSAFAASGTVAVATVVRRLARSHLDRRRATVALAVALLVTVPVVAVAEQRALGPPVAANEALSEKHAAAYEPFEDRDLSNALVFVPTPYGGWLNHPFQVLRNGPSLGGDVVYVQDRDAADDFAVVDAYDDRTLYRYTYRGQWGPAADATVTPRLEELAVQEGERVRLETTVGIPANTDHVTVQLESGDVVATYTLNATARGTVDGDGPGGDGAAGYTTSDDVATLTWVVTPDGARVVGENVTATGRATVPVDDATTASLAVTVAQPGGSTFTYRQDASVASGGDSVRVLWPPQTRLCLLTTDCGREGTYLPGEVPIDGAFVNATVATSPGRSAAVAPPA